jgi:hypothetical protein
MIWECPSQAEACDYHNCNLAISFIGLINVSRMVMLIKDFTLNGGNEEMKR